MVTEPIRIVLSFITLRNSAYHPLVVLSIPEVRSSFSDKRYPGLLTKQQNNLGSFLIQQGLIGKMPDTVLLLDMLTAGLFYFGWFHNRCCCCCLNVGRRHEHDIDYVIKSRVFH